MSVNMMAASRRCSEGGITASPELRLAGPCRLGPQLSPPRFGVVIMSAAKERHLVEHVLLEPFQPEIDDRCDEQRDQLRENQTAHDHQTQWPTRCGILTESQCNWDCAHKGGECGHHDRTKPFHAGFVNRRAQVPTFINSLQSKIDHHDSVLLHNT